MSSSRDALVDEIRQLNRSLGVAIRNAAKRESAYAQVVRERDELKSGREYVMRHLFRSLYISVGVDLGDDEKDAWEVWTAKTRQLVARYEPGDVAVRNNLGTDSEQRLERTLAELKSMAAAIERKDELSQTTMLGKCPGCGRPLSDADDLSGECDHYNEKQCRGGMFGGCCSCTCSDYDD